MYDTNVLVLLNLGLHFCTFLKRSFWSQCTDERTKDDPEGPLHYHNDNHYLIILYHIMIIIVPSCRERSDLIGHHTRSYTQS